MLLTPMKILSDAEMASFEDECFRDWLNRVDARIEYDTRRNSGTVAEWRITFNKGHSEQSAIEVIVNHSDYL